MANRATFDGPLRFYAKSMDVTARVAFGASGAPTLITGKSRGVVGVTRIAQGIFQFQFGTKRGALIVPDNYVWTENVETAADVSCTQNTAAAAVGQASIYRDDILSGANTALRTPVQSALATAAGGTLGAATYYYTVTAIDAKGKETLESNEQSIATGASGKNTISWAAVPGAVGYRVYRGTAAGAENSVYVVAGGATTSFVDTGTASQANAAVDPPIQARPPIAAASVTIALPNGTGVLTDPANGEIVRFTFTFIDSTAG